MKALVAIKKVIDHAVRIRVKADQSGVETTNVKMAMNPFDAIALEAAIQLKEQKLIDHVTVVTIGDLNTQDILRQALALGADTATLITCNNPKLLIPLNIAKILAHVARDQQAQLLLLGKQSIDGDNNQTGQILATLLGYPQATYASKIALTTSHVTVTREIDGGLETLFLTLPAVITTDLRLNQPRYATLPNIMQAKSRPLNIIDLATLPLALREHITVNSITAPPKRQGNCQFVTSARELLQKLQENGAL